MGQERPEHTTRELTRLNPPDSAYESELLEARRALDSTRAQLSTTLNELHQEVEEQLDWRKWIDENPWKAVGIAFGAGIYFGMR